ncbi:MAG: ZIP family metal transporter [Syntrophomonadaceae bacterium]|jgi:ZIP family zinc transporter
MTENLLYISCAAGFCTTLGAALLFFKREWTNRSLAIFLGLASGVMIAVTAFDMLPSALLFYGYKKALAGFCLGFLLLWSFNAVILRNRAKKDTLIGLGYLIMLGIALHDLPEGMAIALGNELKGRTGIVIALGIGIHNIPEGMAIAAPLIMGGLNRIRIVFQTLLIGLITPIGTIIGQITVLSLPQLLPLLLGLASGIMVYLVMFQLWPEAGLKGKRSRWIGFWLGMMIIITATYL